MEFKDIVTKRYAAKSFSDKKVSLTHIDSLLELIRLAPSGFNIQPWKVYVITDQHLKDSIQKASWNQPQVGTCSHLLVFCANTDVKSNIKRLEAALPNIDSVKAYVQMMKDWEGRMDDAAKKAWAQRQVFIALSHALNGATSLGLDSCPMEGFDPAEVGKILAVPNNLVVTALAPIGYANDTARPKFRFATQDVFVKK